jgi:hypothetical protein
MLRNTLEYKPRDLRDHYRKLGFLEGTLRTINQIPLLEGNNFKYKTKEIEVKNFMFTKKFPFFKIEKLKVEVKTEDYHAFIIRVTHEALLNLESGVDE